MPRPPRLLPAVTALALACAREPIAPPAVPAAAADGTASSPAAPESRAAAAAAAAPTPGGDAGTLRARPGDLEVQVRRLDTSLDDPIVLLGPTDGSLVVPISIGAAEALAIATVMQGVKTPRPMTHDLMRDLLDVFEARLAAVRVTEVRDHTFYARLVLEIGGNQFDVDSRPSDAIALALRARAPIFLAGAVVDAAAIRKPAGPQTEAGIPGLAVQALSPALARQFGLPGARGVLVADVEAGSAAEAAGLRPGDVIIEVAGAAVADPGQLAARLAARIAAGSGAAVVVMRAGQRSEFLVPTP